ncbi:MAG: Gfo/Idh/MocA family oxidoreductase [Bryobacterales bacterium]|nr:Gfo/Idh/MocA family oxidoreductase [Bryobacterales bacterium]
MSSISRRTFFQGAALAASATQVIGANDRIRVGIVGIGGRGMNHLEYYLRLPDAQIAGLCDVNQAARERAQSAVAKANSAKAGEFNDMRKMFDSKDIDAVSIATPNHWHALSAIWAAEAGKDVYVEKPASHNIYEGTRMLETARKYKRMMQVGSQSRTIPHKRKAIQLLHEGIIGDVYEARALCFKRRKSIGVTPPEPVPAGIDWDLFLGPAPMRPFTANRFKYNWHWFWDTGNGDIGNQGVHEMDVARWGLGDVAWPDTVVSDGGKWIYTDDQETPNTQIATFACPGNKMVVFEVRGMVTGPEAGLPVKPGNTVGNLFLGANGWLWMDSQGFQVYEGEGNKQVMAEKGNDGPGTVQHFQNFLEACRSRDHKKLNAEIEIGATSAAWCHMANIAYRTKEKLAWDPSTMKFKGSAEANKHISRDYRKPFVV